VFGGGSALWHIRNIIVDIVCEVEAAEAVEGVRRWSDEGVRRLQKVRKLQKVQKVESDEQERKVEPHSVSRLVG